MYHDVYLLRSDAEKPFGLNDLETFVHHRRGIYGYLAAHRPIRVLERVTGLRPGNPRLLPGAERPAGSRQVYLGQGVAVCPEQALEDCRQRKPSFALEQVALDIIISTGIVSNFETHEAQPNPKDDYY